MPFGHDTPPSSPPRRVSTSYNYWQQYFKCGTCEMQFVSKRELDKHIESDHVTCFVCENIFRNQRELEVHKARSPVCCFICQMCKTAFLTKDALDIHRCSNRCSNNLENNLEKWTIPSSKGHWNARMQFEPYTQLRVIRTHTTDWVTEHQKQSLLLTSRKGYQNLNIKIHYLREDELGPFEVRIMNNTLVDVLGRKITTKNGIFVVRRNGKMYTTPDRNDNERVSYPNDEVLCHCSFDIDEVFFAGLITINNGIPSSLCNESGTFFPGMAHTTRVRNILASIMNIYQENIRLDFVISEEILKEQIRDMLSKGYEKEIQNLITNSFNNGCDETIGNIMLETYNNFRSENVIRYIPHQSSAHQSPGFIQPQQFPPHQLCEQQSQSKQQSNSNNDESNICVVCTVKPKSVLLLPCKHLCLCEDCIKKVQVSGNACPTCRANIENTVNGVFIV